MQPKIEGKAEFTVIIGTIQDKSLGTLHRLAPFRTNLCIQGARRDNISVFYEGGGGGGGKLRNYNIDFSMPKGLSQGSIM